jgi:hypothetical protein
MTPADSGTRRGTADLNVARYDHPLSPENLFSTVFMR